MPLPKNTPSAPRIVSARAAFHERFLASLKALQTASTEFSELAGQMRDVARDMPIETLAQITVALKDAREAASSCKTQCTDVRNHVDKHFILHLEAHGEDKYRTPTHTFSADIKWFFTPPNPNTQPDEFEEYVRWLRSQKTDDPLFAERTLVNDKGLSEYCDKVLQDGGNLPSFIKKFPNPTVRITHRK